MTVNGVFCLLSAEKRYSNLCALCEDPVKCDYPDKYSGYDGSIRCLAENGGDVAFTKVIFVNRYFGVSVRCVQLVSVMWFLRLFMSVICQLCQTDQHQTRIAP